VTRRGAPRAGAPRHPLRSKTDRHGGMTPPVSSYRRPDPLMASFLLPCPSCARHVRVDSGACPFCGGPLPASFRSLVAPRVTRRASRAGMYAHTARASLLAIAAAGCGGLATGGDGGVQKEAGSTDGTLVDHVIIPVDGGPDASLDRTLESDALEAGSFDSSLRDSAAPSDATCQPDACPFNGRCCGDRCCPAPPYGAPFPPDSDIPE
jgi:hypothetical protein